MISLALAWYGRKHKIDEMLFFVTGMFDTAIILVAILAMTGSIK